MKTALVAVAALPLLVTAAASSASAAPPTAASSAPSAIAEPPGVSVGLEQRLADLPRDASPEQVVQAMYPGDAAAQALALSATPADAARFGWGDAWKITKCVAAIGGFIAGNALLISKASKFGGVAKGVKLIVEAGNKEERLKLLIGIFGEVTGIGAVAATCG